MAKRPIRRRPKNSPNHAKPATEPKKALPPPQQGHFPNPEGSVDLTGTMPEGIRIDPDITQGHPGYEESGDSEIIPPDRPSAPEKKDKPAH
jgi:hypothetical protein